MALITWCPLEFSTLIKIQYHLWLIYSAIIYSATTYTLEILSPILQETAMQLCLLHGEPL